MTMAGAALLSLAAAIAVVMGLVGVAHIERDWLRWFLMIVYVLVIVAAIFGLPILLGVFT